MATVSIAMLDYGMSAAGRPILKDTAWWQELVVNRCGDCTDFVLRCADEDADGKAFGERHGWLLMRSKTGEWVYRGECGDGFFAAILAFPAASDGPLVGSALHLARDGSMIVSLREYGLELYLHGLRDREIAQTRAWASRFACMADIEIIQEDEY